MASEPEDTSLDIGQTLKETRQRLGHDILALEERTKIRAKYLRALENEDWEVLPGPTYVRAFLRTYANELGLDGQILADELRRRWEAPDSEEQPVAEPVLEGGRAPREGGIPGGPRSLAIAAIGAALVAILLVLGLTGGAGEDEPERVGNRGGEQRQGGGQGGGNRDRGSGGRDEAPAVTLGLVAQTDIQACVVAGDGTVLIENEVLEAGSEEDLGEARRFTVDLDFGTAQILANNATIPAEADDEPVSYRVTADSTDPIAYTGPECP